MIRRINAILRGVCLWLAIAVTFVALLAGLVMVAYGIYDATMRASILFDTTGL